METISIFLLKSNRRKSNLQINYLENKLIFLSTSLP